MDQSLKLCFYDQIVHSMTKIKYDVLLIRNMEKHAALHPLVAARSFDELFSQKWSSIADVYADASRSQNSMTCLMFRIQRLEAGNCILLEANSLKYCLISQ